MRIVLTPDVTPRNNVKAIEQRITNGESSSGIKIAQIKTPLEPATITSSNLLFWAINAEHAHHPSLKMLAVNKKYDLY
jgi:hypothetical protein